MIDEKKIKNKKIKGCVICQNPELAKRIDPIIFKAEMNLKALREKLENEGIFLELDQLKHHTAHIFYEEMIFNPDGELRQIRKLSNKELIEIELARIEKQIKKLLKEGKEATNNYIRLLREKKDLIALKAKIEGEMVEKIEHTLPGWLEELVDKEEGN